MTEEDYRLLMGYLVDVEQGQDYHWCGCGLSKSQPFCSQLNEKCCAQSVKFTATINDTVAFCMCKKTKTPPFCDGSHASVLREKMQQLANKKSKG